MNEPVVYGIPNCDTVKKARAWLAAQGVACRFHDFRKDGVPAQALARWQARRGFRDRLVGDSTPALPRWCAPELRRITRAEGLYPRPETTP